MGVRRCIQASKATVCAALLCGIMTVGRGDAQAMRDPTFRGVRRLVVLAQYGPAGRIAGGAASDSLCAEILPLALRGAPVPVTCAHVGDTVLDQTGTMVVVAQASVTPGSGGAPLFAVAMRPVWSGGLEPSPIYFGAAPRVVSYSPTSAGRTARRSVLDAALADVLPWRRRGEIGGGSPGLTRE